MNANSGIWKINYNSSSYYSSLELIYFVQAASFWSPDFYFDQKKISHLLLSSSHDKDLLYCQVCTIFVSFKSSGKKVSRWVYISHSVVVWRECLLYHSTGLYCHLLFTHRSNSHTSGKIYCISPSVRPELLWP